jgi:hypothetical protein
MRLFFDVPTLAAAKLNGFISCSSMLIPFFINSLHSNTNWRMLLHCSSIQLFELLIQLLKLLQVLPELQLFLFGQLDLFAWNRIPLLFQENLSLSNIQNFLQQLLSRKAAEFADAGRCALPRCAGLRLLLDGTEGSVWKNFSHLSQAQLTLKFARHCKCCCVTQRKQVLVPVHFARPTRIFSCGTLGHHQQKRHPVP